MRNDINLLLNLHKDKIFTAPENAVHVSIEIMGGRDRMSDGQHKTKEAIEASGGVYYIAENLENFVRWYRELLSLGSNGN
jgi:hypothetical protein